MKIGAFQEKKTARHAPRIFLSLLKQEKQDLGNPERVDIILTGDKVIIQPGTQIKLDNSVLCFRNSISRVLANFILPAKTRPIRYTLSNGKFILDAFEIMRMIESWSKPSKERKDETFFRPQDNKSGECKHFKNPMSPKTIYTIAAEVDTYFSDGRYLKDHSDKQIAAALDVSELSVVKIREEVFGPILVDPKQERIDELAKKMKTLQAELLRLQEYPHGDGT